MRIKNGANKIATGLLRALGNLMSLKRLPVLFHGYTLLFAKEGWPGAYSNYEAYMAAAISEHLPPGGVFYDVGAHFGIWSVFASKISGSAGAVFAYEPSDAFRVLEKNANQAPNIKASRIALGSENTEIKFYGQGMATSGSLIESVTRINEMYSRDPIKPIMVSVRTLDGLLQENSRPPDVLKVDVEGYELRVLEGAKDLIARHMPIWIIEIHPTQLEHCGGSDKKLLSFLSQMGYAIKTISREENGLYTVVAKRPSTTAK